MRAIEQSIPSLIMVLLTNCLASVEGGCLGYPWASTVASQPLDRILLPWLANARNPAMSSIPGTRHTQSDETVEGRKIGMGGGEDAN